MSESFNKRSRPQRNLLRARKQHGEEVRNWLEDRFAKSKKRIDAKRKDAEPKVSRIPGWLKYVPAQRRDVIVSHGDDNHAARRRQSRVERTTLPSGRKGRAVRYTRGGLNQPHYSHERGVKKENHKNPRVVRSRTSTR